MKLKNGIIALCACVFTLTCFAVPAHGIGKPDVKYSECALVYCIESNQRLYESNTDRVIYPAGLVKLMTALVASEYALGLDEGYGRICTVSPTAYYSTAGNDINLQLGEQMSMYNLLVGVLLAGANDCANVLAEEVAGSIDEFVLMMNEKAESLGMTNTHYTNPTGLHDDEMVTTVDDLLILALYASADQYISEIAAKKTETIPATNRDNARYLGTRNYLVSDNAVSGYYYRYATGLACGSTVQGGYCVIGTASHNGLNFIAISTGAQNVKVIDREQVLEVDENGDLVYDDEGNPVILVEEISHTDFRGLTDAKNMLYWADSSFRYIKAVDRSTPICEIKVRLAKNTDRAVLLPEFPIELFVPTDVDRVNDIVLDWTLDSDVLYAPVKAGERVGTVRVTYMGDFIGEVPLIVNTTIEQSTMLVILDAAWQICKTPFARVALISIAVAVIAYIIINAVERQKKKNAAKRRRLHSTDTKYLQ